MPDVTTLVIAGGAWTLLLMMTCALCAAAGRADSAQQREEEAARAPAPPAPAVVADTGGLRTRLRAADGIIDAEQLAVVSRVGGTEVVLATSRAVVEAQAGAWVKIDTPVRVGGRRVAMLRAVRRPGAPPFDSTDRLLLQALARRIAESIAAGTARADHPNALA